MTKKVFPVSFRWPMEKKMALEKIAADQDRSLSWLIDKVLTQYLVDETHKNEGTKE